MADFKKLTVDGNTYDVKDAVARTNAASAQTAAGNAQNRADAAYNLANTADLNASQRIPKSGPIGGAVSAYTTGSDSISFLSSGSGTFTADDNLNLSGTPVNIQGTGNGVNIQGTHLNVQTDDGSIVTSSNDITISADGGLYLSSDDSFVLTTANGDIELIASSGTAYLNNEELATQPWVLDQIPEPGDLGSDPSPIPFNLAYNKMPTPPLHVIDKKMQKLIGGSIAWNQLKGMGDTSVTVRSGHKYIAYIGGTWSLGASTGAAVSTPGSSDMFFDLTYAFGSDTADAIYALGSTGAVALFQRYFPETSYVESKDVLYHAEPYKAYNETSDASEHEEYALASGTVQLRGRYTLNNGKLECDGDEWTPDGTITRKYGIVDLGDLSWGYSSSRRIFYTATSLPNCPVVAGASKAKILCPGYDVVTANNQYDNSPDMSIAIGSSIGSQLLMCVNDAYTTAADFKTAMSGIYVLYPLASETTEAATTYEETMTIYTGGFEELQDYQFEGRYRDVAVPIGSLALYTRKTVAMPTAPTAPGDYYLTAHVGNDGTTLYVWEQ